MPDSHHHGFPPPMKLSALRDLLAIAERGSLRAAARQLGVAQPAMTRSIQELEKELGIVLFERSAQGIRFTPMGELFLRRAKTVNSELVRAQEELDQMRGETNGHLNMCLSSVPHMALLPNALRPFLARYPNVKLRIIDGVFPLVESELRNGVVDCYIGPVPEQMPGGMAVEKLFDNTRVILGRKGHPLAHARSLRELAKAEWVTTSITRQAEDELVPIFTQHGLPPPKIVVEARSALTFLTTLVSSDLLMILPIQWTQSPLFRTALQRIEVEELLPAPPICIVQRTGLPLTPAGEYFCDMMRRASHHMETLMD
ncbi:MAG: LysR substrate-binding domain-containing protein [Pseudomonadota bacterium]|nr:LysR substrate-binding domain-containing protein [Pseudomonadota bacterium]